MAYYRIFLKSFFACSKIDPGLIELILVRFKYYFWYYFYLKPLLRAIASGQEETAKQLLEAGANPNASSNAGDSVNDYAGKLSEKFKSFYQGRRNKISSGRRIR